MAKLVVGTYGNALFELAVETAQVDQILWEVKEISQVLRENSDFFKLMNHPKIEKEEKIRILERVFRGHIHKELLGLMEMLLFKDHYNEMESVFSYFTEQAKGYKNIGTAYVTSPVPLNDIQKEQIQEKLLETTNYESFELHYTEDRSLIGGLIIGIGDRVADGSIRTKLEQLRRKLLLNG